MNEVSSAVIFCSHTQSEENLGWLISPEYTAGPPGQPFPTQTSPQTQDWYIGLTQVCSGPCAAFSKEQGQSQEPIQL